MVVGDNVSTATKNAGELLAISIADGAHPGIYFKATRCHHWSIACTLSPQRPPWSTNLNETHKTLTKQNPPERTNV